MDSYQSTGIRIRSIRRALTNPNLKKRRKKDGNEEDDEEAEEKEEEDDLEGRR